MGTLSEIRPARPEAICVFAFFLPGAQESDMIRAGDSLNDCARAVKSGGATVHAVESHPAGRDMPEGLYPITRRASR